MIGDFDLGQLVSIRSSWRASLGLILVCALVLATSCGDDGGDNGDGSCEEGETYDSERERCVGGNSESSEEVDGVVSAVNDARSEEQDCGEFGEMPAVDPVDAHPDLNAAAQGHADDMAENDFFDHTGSDGSSFSERIDESGYPGSPLAENIAGGATEPEAVVDQWLESGGHCRNLMLEQADEIGVGYAEGGDFGTLWVLKFGMQ